MSKVKIMVNNTTPTLVPSKTSEIDNDTDFISGVNVNGVPLTHEVDEEDHNKHSVNVSVPVNSVNGQIGEVTLNKNDIGLGNADNTADLDKPISTATQTALDGKVDKVTGKGLSTEDYTTEEKTKLADIEAGAQVNVIQTVKRNGVALTPDAYKAVDIAVPTDTIQLDNSAGFITQASAQQLIAQAVATEAATRRTEDNKKVDKETGKGLSTNDYTTEEKTKLAGIMSGAQVNVIEAIKLNNVTLTPDADHAVNIQVPTDESIIDAKIDKAIIKRTASGNPAIFDDGGDDLPIVSLVATISPIQSGSGDPSPTNVRPISGTTQITFGVNNSEFTTDLGRTVYGGTLDATSGVLTVTWGIVDLGALSWWLDGSRFKTVIPNGIVTGKYASSVAYAICSAYPYYYRPDTQPDKTFTFSSTYDSASLAILGIKDSSYTDDATFKTAMSGVQFVYKLATPLTYQLTPHEANTVLGANTIYTGSGFPVTVTYRADPSIVIEDIIDAITSLGGNV